jgi:hypothetical protein
MNIIFKNIVHAQIASDGGKEIDDLCFTEGALKMSKMYYKKGYNAKDSCIRKAIKNINACKNSGVYYNIKETYEFRNTCYIIYFNFKIDGVRHQVSFHSFGKWKETPECSTRWNHKLDSRKTVELILKTYNTKQSQ